ADGRRFFELAMEYLEVPANWAVGKLYSPRLQRQILLIIVVTISVAALPLARGNWFKSTIFTPIDPFFALMWVVGIACAIGAARQAKFHRPASLLLSGGAGLVTSLTFAWLSAPDLALAQLAVEVVTVVLILLGLRWLPQRVGDMPGAQANSGRALLRRS